ncbi:MAG: HAD-IA family hydrolase [Paludibacteraceae bacterium]|nr:HAD-IA family hydrolase [Paludibacteraceae bacterium]
MPEKTKAFLFDMDGVIFDSMPFHAKAWSDAFKEFGIAFSEYQVYLQEGSTGFKTVNDVFMQQKGRCATEQEVDAIYGLKCRIFEKIGCNKPMAYMDKLLSYLKGKGYIIGIVTGSGQKSLIEKLDDAYPGIFSKERMVTAYDVTKGKPDPEPYLKGLVKVGVNADEAVVIENAPLGIQAAKAAGIYTIGINTGILDIQCLKESGADEVFGSVKEWYEKITK